MLHRVFPAAFPFLLAAFAALREISGCFEVSGQGLEGLAVTISFQEGESVQPEFYRVKDALLDWKRSRGEPCGALELEYQADKSCWPQRAILGRQVH